MWKFFKYVSYSRYATLFMNTKRKWKVNIKCWCLIDIVVSITNWKGNNENIKSSDFPVVFSSYAYRCWNILFLLLKVLPSLLYIIKYFPFRHDLHFFVWEFKSGSLGQSGQNGTAALQCDIFFWEFLNEKNTLNCRS